MEHTRRAIKSFLYGSPTASGSSAGLSAGERKVRDLAETGTSTLTGVLCNLELLFLLLLSFLSPHLSLRLFSVRESGLLALFHPLAGAGLHHALSLVFAQLGEKLADAVDMLWPDAVDVLVEGTRVRQGWPRCEEFEEVRWQ